MKYRQLYRTREVGGSGGGQYTWVEVADGSRRRATSEELRDLPEGARILRPAPFTSQTTRVGQTTVFPIELDGQEYVPNKGGWKTNRAGVSTLLKAGRLLGVGKTLTYVRYFDDFAAFPYNNLWDDTVTSGFGDPKVYVVQTNAKVIERCMLMCTDPGDLVVDPTCGSGTTAYVAEQWGRRWITVDTSRVALALARQRLMGSRFPYYLLTDSEEGRRKESELTASLLPPTETHGDIRHGFVYERVQHITLKSIANNPDIVEGMTRDEIDAAIRRHADFELLYDKPYEDRKKVRVTGPFTVESLSPHRSIAFAQTGEPASERAAAVDPEAPTFEQTILANLQQAGIQNGRRKERLRFEHVEPFAGTFIQAIGTAKTHPTPTPPPALTPASELGAPSPTPTPTPPPSELGTSDVDNRRQTFSVQGVPADDAASIDDSGDVPRRVGISVGPQYGTVDPRYLKGAAREAMKADIDLLAVLGFAFDPTAIGSLDDIATSDEGFAEVAGERTLGRMPVLLVRMNADLSMGEELKKTGAGNLFTVFGEPDIEIVDVGDDVAVVLRGVDVYDPTTGEVRSDETDRVALWMIDTDYNDESFFVRQCYFTGGQDPYKRLKTALKSDIDADAWASLYSTTSRPFARPSTGKIAVKVINDYGDEVLKVFDLP